MRLPFRQRLRPECRQRLLRAAAARFADGDTLWQSGRRAGAIYLWGYSAEIWLKAAYFRNMGFSSLQPITTTLMWQHLIQLAAQSQGTFLKPANLHDVAAWSDAVIHVRQILGRPMTVQFASQLSACCRRIANGWSETIRYHENEAWPHEAAAFRRDVLWVRNRARVL